MAVGSVLQADGAGRDLVAADVALGAGFGTTATKVIAPGSNRSRGSVIVTSAGTGQAQATADIVITFPEPFDEVPFAVVGRGGINAGGTAVVTVFPKVKAITKTALTINGNTLPVAAETTEFSYAVVG